MRPDEIAQEIKEGIDAVEATFVKRTSVVTARLQAHHRLMDELERALDDVSPEDLRQTLRALAAELENAYRNVIGELDGLVTYEMFDPLRVVAADVL
jgi:hypothetical protein